jgi:hypothetical protein
LGLFVICVMLLANYIPEGIYLVDKIFRWSSMLSHHISSCQRCPFIQYKGTWMSVTSSLQVFYKPSMRGSAKGEEWGIVTPGASPDASYMLFSMLNPLFKFSLALRKIFIIH